MKRTICIAIAALGLGVAQPTLAQDEPEADGQAEMMAAFAGIFAVEPLTAEQADRLPQAQELVARIMPPGTMKEVMGGMFDKIIGPLSGLAGQPNSSAVAETLGLEAESLDLGEDEAARAMAILDPAWKERQQIAFTVMEEVMEEVMDKAMIAMEPAMREGLAEAYAANFSVKELDDIGAFFATPSGEAYARKSYALASDPRIMGASMKMLPAMMEQMADVEQRMAQANEALPAERTYAELTPAERTELMELTGVSASEIEDGLAKRAEAESETEMSETDD